MTGEDEVSTAMNKPIAVSVHALVRDPEGRFLLVRRSPNSRHDPGAWEFPGGKCEEGESFESALTREVAEETGLTVANPRLVASSRWEMDVRVVLSLFFLVDVGPETARTSDEHDALVWVPRERLGEHQASARAAALFQALAVSDDCIQPIHPIWYQAQIEGYRRLRPLYEEFGARLVRVFEKAEHDLGLHTIVQARAKSLPSFAEKVRRPNRDFKDPLNEMGDLCGVRIVTHTVGEVELVSKYVEEHFDVSRADSGDKEEGLASDAFGYTSKHFAVRPKPGAFSTSIIPDELVALGLRAEVQVRTIPQHAWADNSHEMSYKNRFKLPRPLHREFARLAALLEKADRGFEEVRLRLREYATNYGAYLSKDDLKKEVEYLEIVLKTAPETAPEVAYTLAQMARCAGDWAKAVEVLTPFADSTSAPLLRDLGVCLCQKHAKAPEGPEFARGQELLGKATKIDPQDWDAWASLGGSWRKRENAAGPDGASRAAHRERARECYRQAFEVDPTNPYPLGNYIEYEMTDHPEVDIIRYFRPSIEAASRRCLQHVEVEINLPWALFDLGKFQFMLGHVPEALAYYLHGVEKSDECFYIDSALSSFQTLAQAKRPLAGLELGRWTLELARAWRFDQRTAEGPPRDPSLKPLKGPIVIVTGSCRDPLNADLRAVVLEAFSGYRGTVLSGGTKSGVCGLVGEVQEQYSDKIRTIGYMPRVLPDHVARDDRYSEHRPTTGEGFSAAEPLTYWTDLKDSSASKADIRLLALGGGPISALECRIALAFGVPVGLVRTGDDQVSRALAKSPWDGHDQLRSLPVEANAIRAFLEDLRQG